MKIEQYTVTGRVFTVSCGVLKLTTRQAATRMHLLKPLKERGMYEVVKPVEFKRGEVIGVPESSISKAAKTALTSVEQEEEGEQKPDTNRTPADDGSTDAGQQGDDGDIDLVLKKGGAAK